METIPNARRARLEFVGLGFWFIRKGTRTWYGAIETLLRRTETEMIQNKSNRIESNSPSPQNQILFHKKRMWTRRRLGTLFVESS
jgi:hypothetical protein